MIKLGDRLLFYLVLKPLSYLPMGVLFIFSDITYFLAYYIIGYRRKVVFENLKKAFPKKTLIKSTIIALYLNECYFCILYDK
jgi:KDO2-lipid IV(A) lauroyltransferase